MARLARGEYIHPEEVQTVHAHGRVVRRSHLCGVDPYTGKNYEHRRNWIRKRLEFLASIFGIDCLTYAVMSNHFHVILRSRPDVVKTWSDEDVAVRWLTLFPSSRKKKDTDEIPEPTEAQINMIVNNPDRLAEIRRRLSDISWWMRCTSEDIARQANREDECTGRFWEGRYKAQLLLDEASLLACAAYVDLNPVRAAMAKSLDESTYTGIFDRIEDLAESLEEESPPDKASKSRKKKRLPDKNRPHNTHRWERGRKRIRSGWLSPIELREASDPPGPDADKSGRRASKKGFLPISLVRYLELLEWTGRQIAQGKKGKIPAESEPVLEKLGLVSSSWCQLVKSFGKLFHRAAGKPEQLHAEAKRRGQKSLRAPGLGLMFGEQSTSSGESDSKPEPDSSTTA